MQTFRITIFESARLKLTLSYLAIIMIISVLFSVVIYLVGVSEVRRGLRQYAIRSQPMNIYDPESRSICTTERVDIIPRRFSLSERHLFEETRGRIAFQLVMLNSAIFLLSGLISYKLAGRTLGPIEKMMDEQKRFISDASHELRTPLTAMRTEIEVILRNATITSQDARTVLESNLEEIDKMHALSERLLKLARFDSRKYVVPFEPVRIDTVLQAAYKNIKAIAKIKSISVHIDSRPETIVYGNMQSLTELCTIILENAIKYSPNHTQVRILLASQRKRVVISVHDQGIGIRKADIPQLFRRFYRVDSSRTSGDIDGFGLGLAIAKGIVEHHQGSIRVESEVGKGSTFHIELPVVSKSQEDLS